VESAGLICPSTTTNTRSIWGTWSWMGCTLAATICLVLCLAIELQNWRAGNFLPRAATDQGKWRLSTAGWGVEHDRDLLRFRVESLGLPLYLLIPLLILWILVNSLFARSRNPRLALVSSTWCLSVSLLVGGLMLHREYFASLGW